MMFTFVFLATLFFGSDAAELIHSENPEIPEQYIVVLKSSALKTEADIVEEHLQKQRKFRAALHRNTLSEEATDYVSSKYASLPDFPAYSCHLTDEELDLVLNDPDVAYVEQDSLFPSVTDIVEGHDDDFLRDIVDTLNETVSRTRCSSVTSANWGTPRINAWEPTSSTTYRWPTDNLDSIDVYVFDTGIRLSHREFAGRARFGYDAIRQSTRNGVGDPDGHGTHCAGTVAGRTLGAAHGVNIIDVRVLDITPSTPNSVIIRGYDWAASQVSRSGRIAIGSASLGGGRSTSHNNAVNAADSAGLVMVVAAGNSNINGCDASPCSASRVFCVGSTTNRDQRSSFSNWGECLWLWAPGSSIRSASSSSDTGTRTMSGTSMACPHVAGVAAIHLAQNRSLSTSGVRSILRERSQRIISAGGGSTSRFLSQSFCN